MGERADTTSEVPLSPYLQYDENIVPVPCGLRPLWDAFSHFASFSPKPEIAAAKLLILILAIALSGASIAVAILLTFAA
jgi:hypothetical protein